MRYGNHWCCNPKTMDIKHSSIMILDNWWKSVHLLMEEKPMIKSILKVFQLQSVLHSKTGRSTTQDLLCSLLAIQETLMPTLRTFYCTKIIFSEDLHWVNQTWSKSCQCSTRSKLYQTKICSTFMSANWTSESIQLMMKSIQNDWNIFIYNTMALSLNIRLSLIIVTDEKEELFITKITRNL